MGNGIPVQRSAGRSCEKTANSTAGLRGSWAPGLTEGGKRGLDGPALAPRRLRPFATGRGMRRFFLAVCQTKV
jgi:hypothetical protein